MAGAKLLELIAALQWYLTSMEACSGAHHWAGEIANFGHTVCLMAAQFVVPGFSTPERLLSGQRAIDSFGSKPPFGVVHKRSVNLSKAYCGSSVTAVPLKADALHTVRGQTEQPLHGDQREPPCQRRLTAIAAKLPLQRYDFRTD